MKTKYTTVSGHSVEIDDTSADAAFLERLKALPGTANDLIALAYSHENPFLDTTIHPSLGVVTKDTLDNPAYRALTDIIFRRKLAEAGTDPAALAAHHTMTVADAAAELGIHESAVRQAIAARRLASWIKDGKHYMKPSTVEAFAKTSGRRGPTRESAAESAARDGFFVRVGHSPDGTLKIAGHRDLAAQRRVERNIVEGWVEHTSMLGVLTEAKDGHARFWVLWHGPTADKEMEVSFRGLFVRGKATSVYQENNAREARTAWRTWRALSADMPNETENDGGALLSRFGRTMQHQELLAQYKVDTFAEITLGIATPSGSATLSVAIENARRPRVLKASSAKYASEVDEGEYRLLRDLGAREEVPELLRP